ncbi:MAG: hypothetical protein PVS3B2_06970 [Candidatus Dormibacteraceae bacterium]
MLGPAVKPQAGSMNEQTGGMNSGNGGDAVIVRIEHPVPDYDMWKNVFDTKGPELRARHGARSYQVLRPLDDPRYVMIDLDFDTLKDAEGFLAAMHQLWAGDGGQVSSDQRARIAAAVETR